MKVSSVFRHLTIQPRHSDRQLSKCPSPEYNNILSKRVSLDQSNGERVSLTERYRDISIIYIRVICKVDCLTFNSESRSRCTALSCLADTLLLLLHTLVVNFLLAIPLQQWVQMMEVERLSFKWFAIRSANSHIDKTGKFELSARCSADCHSQFGFLRSS